MPTVIPSLPQSDTPEQLAQREFQLSIAGTAYNYMHTYMPGVGLSANLPPEEEFNFEYKMKLIPIVVTMMANLLSVLDDLLDKEFESNKTESIFNRIRNATEELFDFDDDSFKEDLDAIKDIYESVKELPSAIGLEWSHVPAKLKQIIHGLKDLQEEVKKDGPTAILKSTLFELLSSNDNRDPLQAESLRDYQALFTRIPLPQMITIEQQDWMKDDGQLPCMQDWFFGYLQIAGFNTTNLRGVKQLPHQNTEVVKLSALLEKFPITDAILQTETGNPNLTLVGAADEDRLYVVDYAALEGATCTPVHNEMRYLAAPIALFYLNPESPEGYPSVEGGVLQPIAIQLLQEPDPVKAPIFTPTDAANANDGNGYKWTIAKYFVNVSCAIQHESIAHLGDCHLEIDPIVVASNRNLAENHPLMVLLKPHFRFTININQSALHSLIIPGGVVATNVGPKIQDTWALVAEAHKNYQFDHNNPEQLFQRRGVDKIPAFPFRDDTKLLWNATKTWVSDYIDIYYPNDDAVLSDNELQNWVNEMLDPAYAGFKGMNGFETTNNEDKPYQLRSKDYLKQVIAQIIYIAGPQHASVNFAQYPLMSFMPSVAGTIYKPAPDKTTQINTEKESIAWYPPLDISCYTYLFEYLLSGLQYDTFGHYDEDQETPYFSDTRVKAPLLKFQASLNDIQKEITQRNDNRPMPYPFQLPEKIPNSISI